MIKSLNYYMASGEELVVDVVVRSMDNPQMFFTYEGCDIIEGGFDDHVYSFGVGNRIHQIPHSRIVQRTIRPKNS